MLRRQVCSLATQGRSCGLGRRAIPVDAARSACLVQLGFGSAVPEVVVVRASITKG